ncbi:hypothetical protein CLV59_108284 [Chitinophaga dinghuensis]|uniref:Uncharacterized protein n=1 Tax=Chitinophaga dinghuensis TaxID=1539050 RepID=A0A327VNU1_9BACT|nr:hypothetical protein [Chitinophaga dinghuensis]RAJ76763.1 hypothetical protein CLV59_108284 [Chitinophaga dinghuensis]
MNEKLEQFTSILNAYNTIYKNSAGADDWFSKQKTVAEKVKKDLEWNLLNDEQKREFRLQKVMHLLNFMEKHNEDLDRLKYEQLLCIWDEQLYATIDKLAALLQSETDPAEQESLFRLHAMFLVEKHLINAEREFVLKPIHNDYYVMMDVMDWFQKSKYAEKLGVANLRQLFHDMYRHWERRPYKEIE